MTTLSAPTDASALRDRLPERRAILDEQRQRQVADLIDLSTDALTLGDGSDRSDEDGSRTNELYLNGRLVTAAAQQLAETDAALARLVDGTYGLCANCEIPISPERLEILPAARYCVDCQANHHTQA
jgi:RNA polymerase-binding transcription factor DksA